MTDTAERHRPSSAAPDLLINRRHLRSFEVREAARPQIDEGQVALAVERFGLTSNNLTYALSGKAMGYWDFFPAENGWGRMPVWGFAEVIESSLPELPAGTRLCGLLPPSSYAVLEPGPVEPWGFEDRSPHRRALPEVYNTYLRVAHDPLHTPDSEEQLAVMRMLFVTAGEGRIQRRRDGAGEEESAFDPGSLPGPTPRFVFAGDPIARHVGDAGVLGLWRLLAEPWRAFLSWTDGWLGIELLNGSAGLAVAYQAIVNGELDPSMGILIEFGA